MAPRDYDFDSSSTLQLVRNSHKHSLVPRPIAREMGLGTRLSQTMVPRPPSVRWPGDEITRACIVNCACAHSLLQNGVALAARR